MRFDIYGRFRLDVQRQGGCWGVFRLSTGVRVPCDDVVIPRDLPESEIATYLDDIFHELAGPGERIQRL